jgi:hypothetical protein
MIRLDLVLLADAASAHAGKLFIHGGGVTRITPPHVPWIHPQLAVVIRLAAEREDFLEPHEVALSLQNPEGGDVLPRTALPVGPVDLHRVEGEDAYVQLAMTFNHMPLQHEGVYRWQFELDGKRVREMAMPLAVTAPQIEPEVSQ